MLVAHLVLEGVQRKEEAYSECGTRTQAGASWQVSHVMDFNSIFNFEKFQASSHGGVFDRTIAIDVLNFRIRDATVIFEKGWELATRYITTLVDRSGQYCAAMLPVPDGIIGTAT